MKIEKIISPDQKILERLRNDKASRESYEEFKESLNGLERSEYKEKKSQWIKEHLL